MSLDTILEREIRERRRAAIHGSLLVLVAFAVFGAIAWAYVQ